MNSRMTLMRPLRARALKLSSPSSTRVIMRVSRTQPLQSQTRSYSSGQKSATGDFYKTFTRPVLKTALLAIFTYQLIYWAWVKLEQDETIVDKQAEVERLEKQVRVLHEAQVAAEKKPTEITTIGGASQAEGKKTKSWYQFW
ncbi:hypothetical protein V8F33_001814 [Rhypophila sp. PSN 637]